jgi:hypothetical protein
VGNPILDDQRTFGLWLQEARTLRDELIAIITEPQDIKNLATEAGVTDVDFTGAPSTIWSNVLNRAAERTLLRKLVERLRAGNVAPSIIRALDAVDKVAALGGSQDPNRMILDGRVFIGRRTLRPLLPSLIKRGSVLVVRGPAGTGRSETQRILFDGNGDLWAYVDENLPIDESMAHIWSVSAGAKQRPPSPTTGPARFKTFWSDVAAEVGLARRMWVVFDDLDKGSQRDDVTLLAETLLERMSDVSFEKRFRVALLGYPKPVVPSKVKPLEDVTHELEEEHVRDFISYCCAVHNKVIASERITSLATSACANARAEATRNGTSFAEELQQGLATWYEGFIR